MGGRISIRTLKQRCRGLDERCGRLFREGPWLPELITRRSRPSAVRALVARLEVFRTSPRGLPIFCRRGLHLRPPGGSDDLTLAANPVFLANTERAGFENLDHGLSGFLYPAAASMACEQAYFATLVGVISRSSPHQMSAISTHETEIRAGETTGGRGCERCAHNPIPRQSSHFNLRWGRTPLSGTTVRCPSIPTECVIADLCFEVLRIGARQTIDNRKHQSYHGILRRPRRAGDIP